MEILHHVLFIKIVKYRNDDMAQFLGLGCGCFPMWSASVSVREELGENKLVFCEAAFSRSVRILLREPVLAKESRKVWGLRW